MLDPRNWRRLVVGILVTILLCAYSWIISRNYCNTMYVLRELSLHYSFPVTIFLHSFLLKTEIIGQTILFCNTFFFISWNKISVNRRWWYLKGPCQKLGSKASFMWHQESNMSGYNVILGRYLADLTGGTECLMVDSKALLSSRLLRFQLIRISAGYQSSR